MNATGAVALAAFGFAGSHLLLSHPLRAPLVRRLGPGAFAGVYSLVAAVFLAAVVLAWRIAPAGAPLWPPGPTASALASALTLLASLLLAGSLRGNPAAPTGGAPAAIPAEARGVFAVTRHPMMWGVALWAAAHALALPTGRQLALSAAIATLALAGSAGQDAKKRRLDPAGWPLWERRTGFLPGAALLAGRARFTGLAPAVWIGGLAFWLAATWLHRPLAGWAVGVWR